MNETCTYKRLWQLLLQGKELKTSLNGEESIGEFSFTFNLCNGLFGTLFNNSLGKIQEMASVREENILQTLPWQHIYCFTHINNLFNNHINLI